MAPSPVANASHVTLQHGDMTVTIRLTWAGYGTDRFGFRYSRVWPGCWQEHGTTKLWREIPPKTVQRAA